MDSTQRNKISKVAPWLIVALMLFVHHTAFTKFKNDQATQLEELANFRGAWMLDIENFKRSLNGDEPISSLTELRALYLGKQTFSQFGE